MADEKKRRSPLAVLLRIILKLVLIVLILACVQLIAAIRRELYSGNRSIMVQGFLPGCP